MLVSYVHSMAILKAYIVLKHEQIVEDIQYGRWRKSQVPLAQTNSEVFWN